MIVKGEACGFCLCTFHVELGQTLSWVFPRDALSKKDASVIAVNSFPDSSRGESCSGGGAGQQRRRDNDADAPTDATTKRMEPTSSGNGHAHSSSGTTTKLTYFFRQPRDDAAARERDGELLTPFVPLVVDPAVPRAEDNATGSGRTEDDGAGDADSDRGSWLYCWVMHEVSRRVELERGAEQRSFVVFSSSPEGAIYETVARELVRRGIIQAIQQQAVASSEARFEHELDALITQMLTPLEPSQAPQPIFLLPSRIGASYATAKGSFGGDFPDVRVVLQRIAPVGSGGWSGSVGSIGPTARLCKASDVAAGAGTWVLSTGGLYQSLRGRASALLPKLWLLWELVLVGEPLVVMSPSPEVSAAAVVALAGMLAPLPPLCDYRPYITIQDPLHRALATRALRCDGKIVGVTNAMMLETLPISSVLSLSSSTAAEADSGAEPRARASMGAGTSSATTTTADTGGDADTRAAAGAHANGANAKENKEGSEEEEDTEDAGEDEKAGGEKLRERSHSDLPVSTDMYSEERENKLGIFSPPASPRASVHQAVHTEPPSSRPASRFAPASEPHRGRGAGAGADVIVAGPLKEGLHTKVRGVLRPCSKTIDLLIAADKLAANPDSFRAACLANDAMLSSHFRDLTTRFLEPLRRFSTVSLVKLERSQPFSAFPALTPLTAEAAVEEMERSRRTSFLVSGGAEFPVSLYRRFLLGCNGRRWLEQTRRRQWVLALARWTETASTKDCFAKMREIDVVSRANILSRLKAEVADKLATRAINEREAMEVCQICTVEVLR